MIVPDHPYSVVTYTGDGVTVLYPLTFTMGYLRKGFVTCRVGDEVDGVGDPVYRTLTWSLGNPDWVTIEGDVPGVGVPIVFRRNVPVDRLLYDFQNGSPLTEISLDESNAQLMMVVQQMLDYYSDVLDVATDEATQIAESTVNTRMAGLQVQVVYLNPQDTSYASYDDLTNTITFYLARGDIPPPGTATTSGSTPVAPGGWQEGWGLTLKADGSTAFSEPRGGVFPGQIVYSSMNTLPDVDKFIFIDGVDGQPGLIPRAAYQGFIDNWLSKPENAAIWVKDSVWQAEVATIGFTLKYSKGDGSTTWRPPFLQECFIGAAGVNRPIGTARLDQIQNIVGVQDFRNVVGGSAGALGGSGAFNAGIVSAVATSTVTSGTSHTSKYQVTFDASRVVRAGERTEPRAVYARVMLCVANANVNATEQNIQVLVDSLVHKLDIVNAFGVGQTWQNMTSNRALNTIYTNTTNKPIMVNISVADQSPCLVALYASTDGANFLVVGRAYVLGSGVGSNGHFTTAVIPKGHYYKAESTGQTITWLELR